jgi:hypothetical protein
MKSDKEVWEYKTINHHIILIRLIRFLIPL